MKVYAKVLALEWGCELDGKECVDKAKELFEAEMKPATGRAKKTLDANLRSIVYCNGLKNSESDQETGNWDKLWGKFAGSSVANEKVTILTALGCTKNTDLLKKYLEKSITGDAIRKQDKSMVFNAVLSGTTEGVQISLDFLVDKLPEIINEYGSMGALAGVITSVADRITTNDQLSKLETFVKDKEPELKDAAKAAQKAVQNAKSNLAWTNTFKAELNNYFHPAPGSASMIGSSFMGLLLIVCIHRFL
jgi:aminopeptidase N